MIVTLTLNPSVDRTIDVPRLTRGAVMRATAAHVDPGGKGVNVARVLLANACKAKAVLPAGGAEGAQLAALLEQEGTEPVLVPVAGAVRANITLVEPDGTVTKFNEPGPELSAEEVAALLEATLDAAGFTAEWVVASGSLPRGVPDTVYADLVHELRGRGICTAIDSSGPALLAALTAGPTLIKPNREELAEATGRHIRTLGDAVEAASALRGAGPTTVLASLGADGAVLIDETGVVHGEAKVEQPRGPVGAGDSLLAGFIAAGATGAHALAESLAWGAAAASLPGSRLPGPTDLDRTAVQISSAIDHDRVLRERS